MFSHDTRLRCDLVDFYYTLYGIRTPVCLPLPELSGIMNLSKFDPNRQKQPPIPKKSHNVPIMDSPSTSSANRESQSIIVENIVECMGVGEEIIMEDVKMKDEPIDVVMEPVVKQKQDYFSDNSVSLPGMGQSGPVGFEPGMFKKESDGKHKTDSSGKVKKKKKDKKKHKHKHKHKHEHKHNKDKEKKDPNKMKVKEETLSSLSSTPSPNPMGFSSGVETL